MAKYYDAISTAYISEICSLTTMEARTVASKASLKKICRNMLNHSDQRASDQRAEE